jgi:hypothetical protein
LIEKWLAPLEKYENFRINDQLKKELGSEIVATKSKTVRELENIDQLLSSGKLNEEQINQLLDERAKLLSGEKSI